MMPVVTEFWLGFGAGMFVGAGGCLFASFGLLMAWASGSR